jgi:hypothetical protein
LEIFWAQQDGSVWQASWSQGALWRPLQFAPPGSAAPTAQPTAVSRTPTSLEVLWIGPEGSVENASWHQHADWARFQLARPGGAAVAGGLASFSRDSNSVEIFWIAPDGSVQGASRQGGGQWKRYPLAPARSASVSGGVTAISHLAGTMEIFWIGPDGSVEGANSRRSGEWTRFRVAPPVSAAVTSSLTGASRTPQGLELWWIGNDGSIESAQWYEGRSWQRTRSAQGATLTGDLTVVSRMSQHLDLFWIGSDGSLQNARWSEAINEWQRRALAPPDSVALHGFVAAVSRAPGSIEVFFTGADGSLQNASWTEAGDWQRYQLASPLASSPDDCPSGTEKERGLCYPRCREGYQGIGPACLRPCPEGFDDAGAACRRGGQIVRKPSYGRGLGSPGWNGCSSEEETSGGWCFPRCREGYRGVGPVCLGSCPEGHADDGVTCRRDVELVAKEGYRRAGYLRRSEYRSLFHRYIREHRNLWLPTAEPLTEEEKAYLRRFFPGRLVESVRVKELEGMTGVFNESAAATTYGNDFIIVRQGERSNVLLKHELVHVCQYDRLGVEGFARVYADQYVDGGYEYREIGLEKQAYGFQPRTGPIAAHLGYCE